MLTLLTIAVIAASSAPPDLVGIAAIITAIVGVGGFVATLIRGSNNNKRVEEIEESASYVKGFEALVHRLQGEIDELRTEHREQTREWRKEREQLERTIQSLKAELREVTAEAALTTAQLKQAQLELTQLQEQIRSFLSPEEYEEFKGHGR